MYTNINIISLTNTSEYISNIKKIKKIQKKEKKKMLEVVMC